MSIRHAYVARRLLQERGLEGSQRTFRDALRAEDYEKMGLMVASELLPEAVRVAVKTGDEKELRVLAVAALCHKTFFEMTSLTCGADEAYVDLLSGNLGSRGARLLSDAMASGRHLRLLPSVYVPTAWERRGRST